MVWILVGLAGAALLLSQLPLLAGIGLSALPLAVLIDRKRWLSHHAITQQRRLARNAR